MLSVRVYCKMNIGSQNRMSQNRLQIMQKQLNYLFKGSSREYHGKVQITLYLCTFLKGQVTRFFASGFFQFPSSPRVSHQDRFKFFENLWIYSQGAPLASVRPVANFATSCANVVDTGDKFATSVNDTSGNLLPVSMTPLANNGNNIRLLRP